MKFMKKKITYCQSSVNYNWKNRPKKWIAVNLIIRNCVITNKKL